MAGIDDEFHRDLLADQLIQIEGLEGATCGPHVKHLAQLALQQASKGVTRDQWRGWVAENLNPELTGHLAEAEECMRSSGLWPWQ